MEKFSNWRDKGTGISPFMPVPVPHSTSSMAPLVFLLRLPVVILTGLLYVVFPIQVVAKSIVLVLLGFNRFDLSVEGVRRSKIDEIDNSRPNVGDFVIANYTSPLDGFFLAGLSNTFWYKIVLLVPDEKGQLYEYSIWSFFWLTLSRDIGVATSKVKADYSKYTNKLVFLFAEGTPSNNKALLSFIPNIPPVPTKLGFNFKTIALRIFPPYLTTPVPVVSPFSYLYQVISHYDRNSYIRAKIIKHDRFSYGNQYNINDASASFELAQLNVISKDLGIQEKRKFYSYFVDYQVSK
ncbi:Lysophosphatidic acid:oleoyl-CoA acyltransferase 1 [Meyerozyma sp. JA9]|nr:Lysophosphatidic acid:oleoyl-CoA acyltransferase 1 [Meyerozyma sp. JA9]